MKHNLAKVLGIEQLAEDRAAFIPTEEQVQQTRAVTFHRYLEDHGQATEAALEAINSANAFSSVIQKNNSTDKVAYELLKIAVEQLKEKTGVVTQGTALESLDPVNYKTEGLQDIKKAVVAIWEAIKKAFFAMVDKIKAFFKGLFDKDKALKKDEEETLKQAENFQKAERKILALGYSPGVIAGTYEGGVKQPEYSGDFHKDENLFKDGDTYVKAYSEKVRRYLGWDARVSKHQKYHEKLTSHISELGNVLKSLSFEGRAFDEHFDRLYSDINKEINSSPVTVYTGKDLLGADIKVIRNGINFDVEIEYRDYVDLKVYPFDTASNFAGVGALASYIKPSGDLLDKSNAHMQRYEKELDTAKKILSLIANKQQQKSWDGLTAESDPEEFASLQKEAAEAQQQWNARYEHIRSIALCLSKLHTYLQGFHSAVLLYVRETINLSVKGYVAKMNKSGQSADVDKFIKSIYG